VGTLGRWVTLTLSYGSADWGLNSCPGQLLGLVLMGFTGDSRWQMPQESNVTSQPAPPPPLGCGGQQSGCDLPSRESRVTLEACRQGFPGLQGRTGLHF
jgi:hypothetical protein